MSVFDRGAARAYVGITKTLMKKHVLAGAHDFGGGKYVTHVKHTITSQNRSVVDDNQLHYVAIVVMKNKIQFWVDAELSFETSLPRPVTDCKGTAIEIGSPDIPSLGEVIFYPHKMTQLHFKEIMFAGFTLEAINEGKVPYVPEQMVSDIIIQKTDKEFSDAHRCQARVNLFLLLLLLLLLQTLSLLLTTPPDDGEGLRTLTMVQRAQRTTSRREGSQDREHFVAHCNVPDCLAGSNLDRQKNRRCSKDHLP